MEVVSIVLGQTKADTGITAGEVIVRKGEELYVGLDGVSLGKQ